MPTGALLLKRGGTGVVYVTLVAAGLTRRLFHESDVVTLQEGRGANEMGEGTAQVRVLQTEQLH